MTLAWHFTGDTLRDGRPIPPVGEWLEHDGPIVLCESGLHASVDVLDALSYAPGPILHRVEVDGRIVYDEDKLVASRRRIVWSVDLTDELREFARACALDVAHLWDCPDIVRRYLVTGDESIREAAGDAARGVLDAQDGARDAALDATWFATVNAARAATQDAAWAIWATAWNAARATGQSATQEAARTAAWNAARDKQRERLLFMITKKSGRE